jgi:hypothetical protein
MMFESVQFKNIKATDAEAKLKDLLKRLQQRRGMDKELATIKSEPKLNILLINAPDADLMQIKQWISLIDVPPATTRPVATQPTTTRPTATQQAGGDGQAKAPPLAAHSIGDGNPPKAGAVMMRPARL